MPPMKATVVLDIWLSLPLWGVLSQLVSAMRKSWLFQPTPSRAGGRPAARHAIVAPVTRSQCPDEGPKGLPAVSGG